MSVIVYLSLVVLALCTDFYQCLTIPATNLISAKKIATAEHGPLSLAPPKWPHQYWVTGILSLPYAEIAEPFSAWYDGTKARSRIDFYGGMDITVQRGDLGSFGQHYQIAPVTTEKVNNTQSCFKLDGAPDGRIGPQHVLPNTENFTFVGVIFYLGNNVNKWTYVHTVGTKTNRYTLLVLQSDNNRPVFYEMLGFDSLLGSHFDDYRITYDFYSTKYPAGVFDAPMKGMNCTGFPGSGAEAKILANPMQEYIHPTKDDHVHAMFSDFTDKYDKRSINKGPVELHRRKNNFKHNLRYIHSMNRKGLSYKLKVNHLADFTKEEIKKLRGRKTTVGQYNGGLPFTPKINLNDLPDTLDWRLFGAVTPVKDQSVCGSCWSFGSTGAIEGALFMKTGKLVRLSQQNLIDCSWGYGNNGCDGGEEFRSYEWVIKHGGIATEYSYGHYLGADGYCHTESAVVGATINSYVNVTSGDLSALQQALAGHGPVAVGIDASHLSFSFYANGVYYEPKCGNTPDNLDHAVLAVGYGIMNGQAYWLIKNSWSTHWGNNGYVLMSQKDNNCGVATDATFVNM